MLVFFNFCEIFGLKITLNHVKKSKMWVKLLITKDRSCIDRRRLTQSKNRITNSGESVGLRGIYFFQCFLCFRKISAHAGNHSFSSLYLKSVIKSKKKNVFSLFISRESIIWRLLSLTLELEMILRVLPWFWLKNITFSKLKGDFETILTRIVCFTLISS